MDTVAQGPLVRHGSVRALLEISGETYSFRVIKRTNGHTSIRIRKLTGERAGADYLAGRTGEVLFCTCPDMMNRRDLARCKHLGALLAAKLFPRPRVRKGVAL